MNLEADGIMAIDRLKDHYKHCIRLSASNKINPKNAFDLQLIDYMQDLVKSSGDGQMNFKIASSALDVGAKIYSNRVDCIQSEAQKVASSILMALDGKHKDSSGDTHADGDTSATSDRLNDSNESNDDARAKTNKRKRATRNRNIKTVIEDSTQLDSKIEKMVLGDPFLDSLSQDYDMSCPAALICYNPLTQPTCLLTIESSSRRKDYLDVSVPKPVIASELPTITEEAEEETTVIKPGCQDSATIDADGDSVMRTETETEPASVDKNPKTNATPTSNSTVQGRSTPGSLTSYLSDQTNLVSLVTKHVNCAQIIRNNQNGRICPRLEHFLFNDRSTAISGLSSSMDDSIMTVNEVIPALSSNRPIGGAYQFDPELYNNNDMGDDHFGDDCSLAGDLDGQGKNENNLIPDLNKIAASKPTDYGYSIEHHRLLNTWAGPHAFKVLKNPQTTKKDGAPKSVRKRAKLEHNSITFEEVYITKGDTLGGKEIRFRADAIRRWKKPLRPQDHNFTEESVQAILHPTFMKPEDTYQCIKTAADALKLVDRDHAYAETGRKSIDDPPSPGLGGFDDVHDDSDDEFHADPVIGAKDQDQGEAMTNGPLGQQVDLEFAGEHLIEQPYTVAQVNIPFAKIAKKMDVRKLKRVMWDLLLPPERREQLISANADITVIENGTNKDDGIGSENNPVFSGDEPNETVIMNGDNVNGTGAAKKTPSPTPSESLVHLEFSNLYGELPVRVSTKMADDLSQPIAFVTLLHLANEKNLKLIPKQDLKDFIIEQDELI